MKKTCRECPWKVSNPPGKFPPERYAALASTADRSHGFPQKVFACHMTPEGGERACAGFVIVVSRDNVSLRLAVSQGQFKPDEIEADDELYGSYAEMAAANGFIMKGRTHDGS